jgi:hypothetical protein
MMEKQLKIFFIATNVYEIQSNYKYICWIWEWHVWISVAYEFATK